MSEKLKIYVVTVFDAGEFKTEPWAVFDNEESANKYADCFNTEWDDGSTATVSVHDLDKGVNE